MDHIAELSRIIQADDLARKRLRLWANATAMLAGNRIHYVETEYVASPNQPRTRAYALSAVEVIPEVAEVLALAEHGAMHADCAQFLCDKGFEDHEIESFLADLLDAQLLVPAIEPQLTGGDAASVLADDLEGAGHAPEISSVLREVIGALRHIDSSGVGVAPQEYDCALQPLERLPVQVDPSRVLQVDMYKSAPALSIPDAVVDELVSGADVLMSMSIRLDRLAEFAARFSDRYETREVPLLEAIDDEVGVGFPEVDSNDRTMRQHAERARQVDVWLSDLRVRAASDGSSTVEITDTDVARLRAVNKLQTPPNAASALATVIATGATNIDRGDYQLFLHVLTGPSGVRLLGRFAHLDDEMESRIRAHLRAEEDLSPGAIFAEIVHLPQGRLGNVTARPALREYEIEYLGRGGGDQRKKLRLADLAVSVRDGRISLRSLSHNREVRPRLSCAHAYFGPQQLPVYRFLASLQDHIAPGTASWNWGSHLRAAHLPRVTRGRVVFARETWSLTAEDIRVFAEVKIGAPHRSFSKWRERSNVPRYFVLADGDNRIPIDGENPCSTRMLLQLIRERTAAQIEEMLPGPTELCVTGPEGRFAHEIVVPLVRVPPPRPSDQAGERAIPVRVAASTVVRRYAPGDEWLYVKLYCGSGSAELLLREIVAPVVRIIQTEHIADKWFFVRYSDPHFHIRIRFHGVPRTLTRTVDLLGAACAPAVASGRVARVVYDTYLPEVERYGGPAAIGIAESLFCADSEFALSMLTREHLSPDEAGERETVAVAAVDRLFTDAGLTSRERIQLLERMIGEPSPFVTRARSTDFRSRRPTIARAVAQSREEGGPTGLTSLLDGRSIAARGVFKSLRDLESRNELTEPIDSILLSMIHMSVNRLVPHAREKEDRVYDFLLRHCISEEARARSSVIGSPRGVTN